LQPTTLQTKSDYRPALLWLMGQIGSAPAASVLEAFKRRLGDLIPAEHEQEYHSGVPIWEKTVQWSRYDLVKAGLMGSGGYGVWTITEAGRKWLRDHPSGDKQALMRLIQQHKRTTGSAPPKRPKPAATPPKSPPAPPAHDSAAHAALDRLLGEIQRFLSGRTERPSDEVLCDWVQLCYMVELHAEAAELFRFVDQNAVAPLLYQRARKLAQAAQAHATIR
jgi:hypothetical protein